jgi:hypothetical protein
MSFTGNNKRKGYRSHKGGKRKSGGRGRGERGRGERGESIVRKEGVSTRTG